MIHTHGICEDGEDSAEVLYKHRDFLFPRMIKGEEGVDWSKTNLFAHLCEKFPVSFLPLSGLWAVFLTSYRRIMNK